MRDYFALSKFTEHLKLRWNGVVAFFFFVRFNCKCSLSVHFVSLRPCNFTELASQYHMDRLAKFISWSSRLLLCCCCFVLYFVCLVKSVSAADFYSVRTTTTTRTITHTAIVSDWMNFLDLLHTKSKALLCMQTKKKWLNFSLQSTNRPIMTFPERKKTTLTLMGTIVHRQHKFTNHHCFIHTFVITYNSIEFSYQLFLPNK